MSTPDEKAKALGVTFTKPEKRPFLNKSARLGNTYQTSGHVSKLVGKLGADLTTEQGYQAAREAMIDVLCSVAAENGTLNNLRVVKLLGCVNATPDFQDCSGVINGASHVVHEIFGTEDAGYHARSALGFATLPFGFAVEVEAILEIVS